MFRIFDKQSTGKTRKLVTFAKQNNCTIICAIPQRMQDKAVRYGIGYVPCISYDDFLKMFAEKSVPSDKYVIDEPENLLSLMFNGDASLMGYDITTEY